MQVKLQNVSAGGLNCLINSLFGSTLDDKTRKQYVRHNAFAISYMPEAEQLQLVSDVLLFDKNENLKQKFLNIYQASGKDIYTSLRELFLEKALEDLVEDINYINEFLDTHKFMDIKYRIKHNNKDIDIASLREEGTLDSIEIDVTNAVHESYKESLLDRESKFHGLLYSKKSEKLQTLMSHIGHAKEIKTANQTNGFLGEGLIQRFIQMSEKYVILFYRRNNNMLNISDIEICQYMRRSHNEYNDDEIEKYANESKDINKSNSPLWDDYLSNIHLTTYQKELDCIYNAIGSNTFQKKTCSILFTVDHYQIITNGREVFEGKKITATKPEMKEREAKENKEETVKQSKFSDEFEYDIKNASPSISFQNSSTQDGVFEIIKNQSAIGRLYKEHQLVKNIKDKSDVEKSHNIALKILQNTCIALQNKYISISSYDIVQFVQIMQQQMMLYPHCGTQKGYEGKNAGFTAWKQDIMRKNTPLQMNKFTIISAEIQRQTTNILNTRSGRCYKNNDTKSMRSYRVIQMLDEGKSINLAKCKSLY